MQNFLHLSANFLVAALIILGKIAAMSGVQVPECCLEIIPVFIGRRTGQFITHSFSQQFLKLICQPSVLIVIASVGTNTVDKEQRQRFHTLLALKVLTLGFKMTLNGKPHHFCLIRVSIDRRAKLLSCMELLAI